MFQRILLGCIALLCFATGYLFWQNQQRKIVYIDSAKLLEGYQAMVEARKEYASKSQQWQANVDTLSIDVQKAMRAYERKSASMTSKERELSTQLLHRKQQELVNYQRTIQQSAQQEETKRTQQVLVRVNAFLTRYGQAQHYDLILIATPAGTIAYAKPGLDVTEEVVRALNQEYGKPVK